MKKFICSLAAVAMAIGVPAVGAQAATESAPEFIGVAKGSSMMTFPTPAETDARLTPSASNPNLYEGTVTINKSGTLAFYTESDGEYTFYTGTSTSTFLSISLSSGLEWPVAGNEEQEENSRLTQNNQTRMYVSQFPKSYPNSVKELEVGLTVDWEAKTFSIVAPDYVMQAPQTLYVWGTLGGFTGSARYTVMATMNETSAGSHVYETSMDIPECGPFEPDGEYKPLEDDPNYGFYFFISDDGTSATKGTLFQLPVENHLIDIPEEGDVFTSSLLMDRTGCNMICLTPGKVKMSYNFDSNTYSVEMLKPLGEEEPVGDNSVTFNFTGVTDAYKYISVFDMEEAEEVAVEGPSIKFEYGDMAMLSFAMAGDLAEDGYTFTISSDGKDGPDTYVIGSGMSMDGGLQQVLKLLPGANGFVFTVNVGMNDTTGIDAAVAADETMTVYNAAGVAVVRNSSVDALRALAPGLYIVNGRKVLVK